MEGEDKQRMHSLVKSLVCSCLGLLRTSGSDALEERFVSLCGNAQRYTVWEWRLGMKVMEVG